MKNEDSDMTIEASQESLPFDIKWREDFRIHIDEIDQEHQHLLALIEGLELDTVEANMGKLLDYTVTHFSNEEAWMQRSGYPALETHMRQHRELEGVVVNLSENGPPWTPDRLQDLRIFVSQWLIGHILLDDLNFGKWYAQHPLNGGLGAPAATGESTFLSQLLKRE